MKKINRIKANEDFAFTIKKGRSIKCSAFVVCTSKNDLGYSRVGISVPNKVGNAVIRTTTRRKIRAMCDSLINYEKNTLDIVIIVKNDFLNHTFNENYESLKELLSVQIGK